MKKPLLFILSLIFMFTAVFSQPAAVQAAGMSISSDSCILLDLNTGQILYGKNPYTLYGDGSFNILLTIITALRIEDAPQELTVSKTALQYYYDTPNLGLKEGQTVTLSDMLKAIYLGGYVDACNVVAENLGVTLVDTTTTEYAVLSPFKKTEAAIDAFIHQMNVTADELGCPTMGATNPDQHFYDTQLCSCLDISYLIREGIKNDEFKKILATATCTVPGDPSLVNDRQQDWKMKKKLAEAAKEAGKTETRKEENTTSASAVSTVPIADEGTADSTKITLSSRNSLLNRDILYSGIKGGAYAFNSNIEKYHALAYAEKDDRKVVAVAMAGDEFLVYDDLQALLNFGFYKWDSVSLDEKTLNNYLPDSIGNKDIAFYGRTDILLPSGYELNDLEFAVSYTEKNYLSGAITVSLPESEAYAGIITTVYFYETDKEFKLLPFLKIIGIILLIILALLLVFFLGRKLFVKSKDKAYHNRIRKTARKVKAKEHGTNNHRQDRDSYSYTPNDYRPTADYRQHSGDSSSGNRREISNRQDRKRRRGKRSGNNR